MYLSLANLNSLLVRQDGEKKRSLDVGTAIFSWLFRLGKEREVVRIQGIEAWDVFTESMVNQCGLDPKKASISVSLLVLGISS